MESFELPNPNRTGPLVGPGGAVSAVSAVGASGRTAGVASSVEQVVGLAPQKGRVQKGETRVMHWVEREELRGYNAPGAEEVELNVVGEQLRIF